MKTNCYPVFLLIVFITHLETDYVFTMCYNRPSYNFLTSWWFSSKYSFEPFSLMFTYLRIVCKTLLHKLFGFFILIVKLAICQLRFVLTCFGAYQFNKWNLIKTFYHSPYDIFQTIAHNQKKYQHEWRIR